MCVLVLLIVPLKRTFQLSISAEKVTKSLVWFVTRPNIDMYAELPSCVTAISQVSYNPKVPLAESLIDTVYFAPLKVVAEKLSNVAIELGFPAALLNCTLYKFTVVSVFS